MRKLKLSFLALALLLSLSFPSYSETYYRISESQLQELEMNSKEKEKLYQESLEEMKKSIAKSEAKNLKNNITIGAVSFSIGLGAGALLVVIFSKK